MSEMHDGRRRVFREQLAGVGGDPGRRKPQSQQQRQLLSCTKCRERKVKCDRTKPCSACCARGAPKDCQFIAEGGDYAPIQQSYELRKLRIENVKLKQRLQAYKISIEEGNEDLAASPDSQVGDRPPSSQKRRAKQQRFQGQDWQDSIYFGSPGLANVIHDFASFNIDSSVNLSHVAPRGANMYATRNPPPHAFATLFKATPEECIPQLLSLLPSRPELLDYLKVFENRISSASFPRVPIELSISEIENFLSDQRHAHLCPDLLALLFATMSLGAQYSTWRKAGGKWDAEIIDKESKKGDVYIAAAMQALRLASFMHRPSLRSIQTLILIGPYLTNSGRFLDAWTLFGTTIRSAHAIGLHRHPKFLDPTPPTQKECYTRQTLWWWMLHMDEQYSMTLGRPLGISGIGDCPWPHELTSDNTTLRFGEFVNHHTVLARSILSSEKLTNTKIDEFSDTLSALLETVPEILQFNPSWIHEETEPSDLSLRIMAAVYYCRTHTYLVLLNRQRTFKPPSTSFTSGTSTSAPFRAVNDVASNHPSPSSTMNAPLRGRAAVLASSEALLCAFMFFYRKDPSSLIDWSLGQQAFNSCMILLFDAIELRRITTTVRRVEHAYVIFKELSDNGVHKIAGLAVERISWGLAELHKISTQTIGEEFTASQYKQEPGIGQEMEGEAETRQEPFDTVMGNSGMLLLEDPGLQGFHQDPFSPVHWNTSGFDTKSTMNEEYRPTSAFHTMDTASDGGSFQHVRSTLNLQGARRSPTARSAPTRYATPTEEDPRSHGSTAPTSPTDFSMPRKRGVETTSSARGDLQTSSEYHRMRPPHLLHAPGSGIARPTGVGKELQDPRLISAYPQQHGPNIQSRHNSCPSLPHHAMNASLLRPTYSSPSNITPSANVPPGLRTQPDVQMSPTTATEHASLYTYLDTVQHPMNDSAMAGDGHPTSAARTALPMASTRNSMMGFPALSDRNYEAGGEIQNVTQQHPSDMLLQHQMTAMPLPYLNTTPPTAGYSPGRLYTDEWRRYVGSSEPG